MFRRVASRWAARIAQQEKLALKQKQFMRMMEQGGNFGVMSAYGPHSKSENQKRHGQLMADLQKMGYRPTPLRGSWEGVAEKSMLIPNMKPEHLFELGKKYDQQSVIYKSKEGVVGMYYPKKGVAEVAMDPKGDPQFDLAQDKSEYSKTRNWSFSLGFAWGKEIPWNGKTPLGQKDVAKALGTEAPTEGKKDSDHKPGDIWQTAQGNWRSKNQKGEARSFKDKGEARDHAHSHP
jgi:hypothetical protein